ncbi:MAG: thioredoxin family protein [Dehalococcoidia bacterium]|nr:thioredoxin family protein [Dehalococcoidia bacterium]
MEIRDLNRRKCFLPAALVIQALLIVMLSCTAPAEETLPSDLTKIPLDSVLGNGKPTLSEFGWRTCTPCKAMKPIMEEVAVQYKGRLNVVIVEIYEHDDLARRHSIRAIPTQIFFGKDGKELTRHEGYLSKERIQAILSLKELING